MSRFLSVRRRWLPGLLVVLAALGGPAAVASAAATSETTQTRFTFMGTNIATCTGADLDVQFRVHDVVHTTTDASGGMLVRFESNAVGLAVDAAGNKYVIAGEFSQSFTQQPGAATEVTFANTFHQISAGPGDNLQIVAIRHMTVDANGRVTSEVDQVVARCVG